MVYPDTDSWRPAPVACSSVWIVGSATLTTATSSTAMNMAMSTVQSSGPFGAAGGVPVRIPVDAATAVVDSAVESLAFAAVVLDM
jgi:hypothetical protein